MSVYEWGGEGEMKGFRFVKVLPNLPDLPDLPDLSGAYPPGNGSAAPPSKEREERRGEAEQEKTREKAKQTRSRAAAKKCKMKQIKRQRA